MPRSWAILAGAAEIQAVDLGEFRSGAGGLRHIARAGLFE